MILVRRVHKASQQEPTSRYRHESCLTIPSEIKRAEIKNFAKLTTSASPYYSLSQYRRKHGGKMGDGGQTPSGMTLKLLAIVQKRGVQVLS